MQDIFNSNWWRNVFINALATVIIGILIILAIGIIGEDYWDNPPVDITSQEPFYLGDLCPGEIKRIHNSVTVEEPVVLVYYISVMDRERLTNLLGTQIVINGIQHPVPGTFHHHISWLVPDLPPGVYARSFAVRGTNTSEKSEFDYNLFTVPIRCFSSDGREP